MFSSVCSREFGAETRAGQMCQNRSSHDYELHSASCDVVRGDVVRYDGSGGVSLLSALTDVSLCRY